MAFDLLIKGSLVVDGTGDAPQVGQTDSYNTSTMNALMLYEYTMMLTNWLIFHCYSLTETCSWLGQNRLVRKQSHRSFTPW